MTGVQTCALPILELYAGIPVVIPAALSLFWAHISFTSLLNLYKALGIIGMVISVAILLTFVVRFFFGIWAIVEGRACGIKALLFSSGLVTQQFWPVMFRVVGIMVVYVFAILPVVLLGMATQHLAIPLEFVFYAIQLI